ncbi:nck-associated protein 5-like isoform X2 [Amia ocellicauda]|uniref:nck-associated protein 5-like isoform X2 n=1 Tax=Amia ocellicauda TaxID=2972642 RepID=UPI003464CA6F
MMSEEAEERPCSEAFDPDEGDEEPFEEGLEVESSRELLERLRELEVENSALALANESQREAYERCLDEVANHVVQALLNQKDLREECIKLKMRVFDLERQNRTLSELFHQKLHTHPGSLQQLPTEPLLEHSTGPGLLSDSNKPEETHTEAQTKGNGERTRNGTPGTRTPGTSMEALSPFFKKKAHILEVLRKLEENDPLKFHPSTGLSSYRDLGQVLAPTESIVPGEYPLQLKAPETDRRSSADSDIHDYMNGEGALPEDNGLDYESCQSCLVFSQKSLDGLFKWKQDNSVSLTKGENVNGLDCKETVVSVPDSMTAQLAVSTSELCTHSTPAEKMSSNFPSEPRNEKPNDLAQFLGNETYLFSLIKDTDQNCSMNGDPEEPLPLDEEIHGPCDANFCNKVPGANLPLQCQSLQRENGDLTPKENLKHTKTVAYQNLSAGQVIGTEEHYIKLEAYSTTEAVNVKNSLYTTTSNLTIPGVPDRSQIAYCEQESTEQICNGLYFSNETCFSKKVAVDSYLPVNTLEKNHVSVQQQAPQGKAKLALSPTSPSCLTDAKASPISSPSRLLKFLKIPSIGERAQAANPLRLSPQLTRSSKIPCRNNNYEVYHSPVTPRKAATAERDRQTPPSKSDSYPATHSAPTSPPKPEDALPLQKEPSYSSHSAPKPSKNAKLTPSGQQHKGFQKVPHYENVSELSTGCQADGSAQFVERVNQTKFPSYLHEGQSEKQIICPEDKLISPIHKQSHLSCGTQLMLLPDPSCETASPDQDAYSENPGWYKLHDHHSLPNSSVIHKSQSSCLYSSTKDRQHDRGTPDVAQQTSESTQPSALSKKGEPPSIPKKPVSGKPPTESSHLPFKERLAALGKLKSTEDSPISGPVLGPPLEKKDVQCNGKFASSSNNERSKTAERQGDRNGVDHRHSKYTDSLDGKPYSKANLGSYGLKIPGPCLPYEPGAKSLPPNFPSPKAELESFSSRIYVAKADGPKIKGGLPSSNSDPPQVLRNYMKCTNTQSPPYNGKTIPSPQGSPTKVPSKSPSKPSQASSSVKGPKPAQEDRSTSQKHSPRAEDKSKLPANRKKNAVYSDSLPPPPPRPDVNADKRPLVPSAQSAIEQKVMKGIEENMLKLQEQDRGLGAEVKQKASNGIASWFGLKKSKLPALNRKPDMVKLKEDKKEWKLNMSSMGKDPKTATKKKLEVESLNISKLMEKAEDLRRALEEERAYVNGVALDRPSRGHSCEVVMDQSQSQLSVMYREVASDNFMQQLLNRVDERDTSSNGLAHRRLSFDSKKSRPVFCSPRNGIISHGKSREEVEKATELISKDDITSVESLAESVNSQHFAGSGSSTRTLDSGIGTFPLPDYAGSASGKSIPKVRPRGEYECCAALGKPSPGTKVPRKARTLERELSSLEEAFSRDKELSPGLYSSPLEGRGSSTHISGTIHEDVDPYRAHVRSPSSKNWTFPNLKASSGSTEVYLGVRGEVEPASHGTPFRRSLKPCLPPPSRDADPASLPLPPPLALVRRVKSRTPSAPEVGKEGGLELVKERPDDVLSPSRPSALETPESLSDSLYDSLSSCGSQG